MHLLQFLNRDLFFLVVNEWLNDSFKDFCNLDVAMANKELRALFYGEGTAMTGVSLMKGMPSIKLEKKLMGLFKWKEKRHLNIMKIHLQEYSSFHGNLLPLIGNLFSTIQDLYFFECCLSLHYIFFAQLPHLKIVSISVCQLIMNEEAMKHCPPTTIVDFQIDEADGSMLCHRDDSDEAEELTTDECRKVFVWIAKCLPNLRSLEIDGSLMVFFSMVQYLPHLTQLECNVCDLSDKEEILNILNQQNKPADCLLLLKHLEKLYLSWEHYNLLKDEIVMMECSQIFVDILIKCCNVNRLTEIALELDYLSLDYEYKLLQSMEHWQAVKHVTLKSTSSSLFTCKQFENCLKYSPQLENYTGRGIFELWSYLPIPCSRRYITSYLKTIALDGINITNESIQNICKSNHHLVQQITSLQLTNINSLSLKTCCEIVKSFTQLRRIKIHLDAFHGDEEIRSTNTDTIFRRKALALVQFLDILFGVQCAFAKTLEVMDIVIPCNDEIKWKSKHLGLPYYIFDVHITRHWQLCFPQLKECLFLSGLNYWDEHNSSNRLPRDDIGKWVINHLLIQAPLLSSLQFGFPAMKKCLKCSKEDLVKLRPSMSLTDILF